MKIGPYKLISELGVGGMAQAWLAHRIWADGERRSCVLKMPRRKAVADEAQMRQFVQEGRISKQLRHRNIPSVFDEGVHEGLPYLVMDFIAGVDLERLHLASTNAQGPWDVETAIYVVREIGQALQYAHGLEDRIIHRDVSTKNIMIDGTGGVLLMDFGIATSFHSMTSRIHVKGTLSYMAPEHYLGQACPASDVFGLGVVLWELLSGRRHRAGLHGDALGKAIVEARFEPLGREVPSDVEHVLRGMLEPRADHRMTLVQMLRAFKRSPDCSDDLKDMIALYFGRAGRRTGLSTVHFAASKELIDTLAVAKAAGVSMSGIRKRKLPGRPRSVPTDFEPQAVGRTSSVDPWAVAVAFGDDVDVDPQPGAAAHALEHLDQPVPSAGPGPLAKVTAREPASATMVVSSHSSAPSPGLNRVADDWGPSGDTLRDEESADRPSPKVEPTVRLDPGSVARPIAASPGDTVAPTQWLSSPLAPDPTAPGMSAEPSTMSREPNAPVGVDWQPSPVREVTSPRSWLMARETEPHPSATEGLEGLVERPQPSGHARSRRWLPLALFAAVSVAILGGGAWWASSRATLSAETSVAVTDGASSEARAAGSAEPPSPSPRTNVEPDPHDERDELHEEPLAVADPAIGPSVVAEATQGQTSDQDEPGAADLPPVPDATDDTDPTSPEPTAEPAPPKSDPKPKRATVKLELVVRRGLAVDFAELKVGRGKVHQVPARGASTLRVPAGTFTLRYRSKEGGAWQSSRYTFSPGMKYAGHIEHSGLRISSAPDEAR